jgi:hypothetical protein
MREGVGDSPIGGHCWVDCPGLNAVEGAPYTGQVVRIKQVVLWFHRATWNADFCPHTRRKLNYKTANDYVKTRGLETS